jgi:hypothetical protein
MIRKSTLAATLKKILGAAAIGVTLSAAPAAQAGVLDFDAPFDGAFLFSGDVIQMGNYYVEALGTGGFAGNIDTNEACSSGQQCPLNNTTKYYTGYDDNYMVFGMLDGSAFSLASLDASFIGSGAGSYPSIAGYLYITGFDAVGVVAETFLPLAGPTTAGFAFANFDLSGFGDGALFTDVRIASYACDSAGNCDRTGNLANFAVDNIVTINASDVPEPGTFALVGLGLLGLRACSRRRTA